MIRALASVPKTNAETAPRVKVFVSDQDSENIIRQALGDVGIDDFTATTGNVTTATALLGKQTSPRLLIVDISGLEDPVSNILDLAEVCEPGIGVIAIGDCNDISLYRQLKNAGVSEYFFKPLVRDQIGRSCMDVLTDRFDQPSLFSGKLVFMLGVRGGVGATTLAANTAWYVSEARQRWTMLLDLDMQSGDAALLFDVAPGQALREAFERPERVDKLFLERGAIHVNKRLNLLASLEPLGSSIEGSEEALRTLLEGLLRRYRVVIVDMPATVAGYLPQILQMPSTCVLVANASLTSARDMARWRDLLGPNTRERRTLHVLNHTDAYGGLTEAEFARACGQTPEIVIAYDRDLATTANLGVKAMQKCPLFKFGMVRMLHDITGEPLEKPASIFRRIFGR
jgi:pilus assembly protein CpaE